MVEYIIDTWLLGLLTEDLYGIGRIEGVLWVGGGSVVVLQQKYQLVPQTQGRHRTDITETPIWRWERERRLRRVGGEGRERKYGQHGQRYWQWSTRALYLCGDCTPRMCTAVVLVWLWSGLVWQDYELLRITVWVFHITHQYNTHTDHECTLRIIIRTHTHHMRIVVKV